MDDEWVAEHTDYDDISGLAFALLSEETTLREQGLSPTLRLHPPRGGHDGVKHPVKEGGSSGNTTPRESTNSWRRCDNDEQKETTACSRTHGGGSHKNRRGAGHRGGRGAAGRDKHEFHNHEPLGKSGFKRPQKVQEEAATIDVREIDENVTLLAADDVAEVEDGGFRVDVRDVVEDADDADYVKVLGAGQVRHELTLIADDFSEGAREKVEAAGGSVELTDLGQERQAEAETDEDADADEE